MELNFWQKNVHRKYAHIAKKVKFKFSLFRSLIGITNLNERRYLNNGTTCVPHPPILLLKLGGSLIGLLRWPPLCSSISSTDYQRFPPEPLHRRGSHPHLYAK